MTGNPWHDERGRFTSKDKALDSYDDAITAAQNGGDTVEAKRLTDERDEMIMDAAPESEKAQKLFADKYGVTGGVSNANNGSDDDNADKKNASSSSFAEALDASGEAYGSIDRKERSKVMLEDLERSVVKMAESGEMHKFMDSMRKNGLNRYSMNNRMLASMQIAKRLEAETGEEVTLGDLSDPKKFNVAGFNQWKDQGRRVKKGSKAVWILAPVIVRDKDADPKEWVRDTKSGELKPPQKVVGFRGQSVFNVTDTEGEPIPENPGINEHYFADDAPEGAMDGLKDHVGQLGFDFEETEIKGTNVETASGALAYVNPTENKVVVDSRLPGRQKILAVAHELGHIEAGHTKDMSEYHKHRGKMETEAEMTGYLVGRELGIVSDGDDGSDAFSASYIAGWAKNDEGDIDHKKVQSAMNNASKAFQKIMESMDKHKDA